jgi:trehalose 6-phosphate phosphatase
LALVAAISGRSVAAARDMVNIDTLVYIGNHGLERWIDGHSEFTKGTEDYLRLIESAIKELTSLLSTKCISIENKRMTATIHYRLCPDHQLARRKILSAIENSRCAGNLRVIQDSKYGINLLPPVKGDKGTGVMDLIQRYDLRGCVYLGDDVTDIYAFRAIRVAASRPDFHGFAIGITGSEMPETLVDEADFTLNGVDDVELFLQWLSRTALDLN